MKMTTSIQSSNDQRLTVFNLIPNSVGTGLIRQHVPAIDQVKPYIKQEDEEPEDKISQQSIGDCRHPILSIKSSFAMHIEEAKPLAGEAILDSGREQKYKIHQL